MATMHTAESKPQAFAGTGHLVPIELDPEEQRDAWLASRLAGYGGSDAAAIVGENTRRRPIDVWQERRGLSEPSDGNDRTEVGRLLEPVVLNWFERGEPQWPHGMSDICVVKPPSAFSAGRPWQRGSADGLVYELAAACALGPNASKRDVLYSPIRPVAGVEVKTHGWAAAQGYESDDDGVYVEVPADKRIQCAWYMELYDLDVWYLAALIDTHLRKTYVLRRDRELGASLLEEVDLFHRRYVLDGVPPPPDGSTSYSKHLAKRFKEHTLEVVDVATGPIADAVAELVEVKRQIKALADRKESAEQVVKAAIAGRMGIKTPLGTTTWKSQASGKLRDKDARAALYGAIGWTNDEIAAFEVQYAQPDHRVLRTPK